MKSILNIFNLSFLTVTLLLTVGCSDDNSSALRLNEDTAIKSFALDNYSGTIDQQKETITITLPEDYDMAAMTVTDIQLPVGAEATLKRGDVLNLNMTQTIKVSNGNVFQQYVIKTRYDEARILTFQLNDMYSGIIDQQNQNILVQVPASTDITKLVPTYTATEGAIVAPAGGTAMDFSRPVDFIVSNNMASAVYTVKVLTPTGKPAAIYAGLASTIEGLNPEEKEAATWMLFNVKDAQYVSFSDIATGNADLCECKMLWWHFHADTTIDDMNKFETAAPAALSAASMIKARYDQGMNLLLTRYATFYAVNIGATKDNKNPNNCWLGRTETDPEITAEPWSFFIQGHKSHPAYQGIHEGNSVYTCSKGYGITNTTAQWHFARKMK